MSWTVVFAIPLILELVLLATGVAFILSTLFVKFRDLGPIWEVGMQAGLYGTPIIYPITQVSSTHPEIAKVLMMNPIAQIVQDMRYILTYSNDANPTVWQMVHNPMIVAIPYIIPPIIFILGLWIFTKNSNKFAEII